MSGTADTSRALFCHGHCVGPDLCGGNSCLQGLGLGMRNAALVSQVLGQERLLKHLSVHGEKY